MPMSTALPVAAPAGGDPSLAAMFFERCARSPRRPALRHRRGSGFVDVTFAAFAERVEAIAAGLLTIPGGLPRGAAVALFASTRAEWLACDFAAFGVGAITVPIYASVLAPEVGYICQDAAVEVIVVEHKAHYDKVRAIADGFTFLEKRYDKSALRLRHIIVMDSTGIAPGDDWESLADLEARGRDIIAGHGGTHPERLARTRALSRDDLATITYTSGTTGAPKGVLQTHGNWLAMLDIAHTMQIFTTGTQQTGAFLFLPLAHAFGRMVGFGGVYFSTVIVLSSPDSLLPDLQATRPGFVPAAPRVYEKIYARLLATVHEQPPLRQKIFAWARDVAERGIAHRQAGQALPPLLSAQAALAEQLVWKKLRARLGLDRIEVMLSGSAALSPTVLKFFLGMNLMLIEAYGLTETCPGISSNRPDTWRIGTVGPLLPGVELRFADDGEICVRGPNITRGYHRRDDANAEAFDAAEHGGWFHTGDIGELDKDGFLRLTDRKKDLLKTSGGKFVAPQKVEGMLKGRPPITEAVVLGDGRKYCVCLVVVDDDALAAWAKRTGQPADRQGAALKAELQAQFDVINKGLASFETIKRFAVIDEPFTVDNGLLTASFKVKRKEVQKRYAAVIDALYDADEGTA
jgi:long-chain acyl-CoA synthetase